MGSWASQRYGPFIEMGKNQAACWGEAKLMIQGSLTAFGMTQLVECAQCADPETGVIPNAVRDPSLA